MREIQLEELEMFKAFIAFCEQHDITYYLCGGTMLGAIRHKGFIPWDDDIDLFVSRPDFERLLSLHETFKTEFPYEMASYRLGNLNRVYMRIFNKQIAVEKEFIDDEFDRYLWMDIFPLDGLPDSREEAEKVFKQIKIYRKMLVWKRARFGKGKTWPSKIGKQLLKVALLPVPMSWILKQMEELVLSHPFETSNYIGEVALGLGGIKEWLPKDPFLQPVQVEFEGLTVNGMGNYEQYLSQKYGNYMELPPVEQREDHSIKAWRLE